MIIQVKQKDIIEEMEIQFEDSYSYQGILTHSFSLLALYPLIQVIANTGG